MESDIAAAARARFVAQLRADAERIFESDPGFAMEIKAEASALALDPAFADLRKSSGRVRNFERMITRTKATRRAID
jgi:hypothetical protein